MLMSLIAAAALTATAPAPVDLPGAERAADTFTHPVVRGDCLTAPGELDGSTAYSFEPCRIIVDDADGVVIGVEIGYPADPPLVAVDTPPTLPSSPAPAQRGDTYTHPPAADPSPVDARRMAIVDSLPPYLSTIARLMIAGAL